MILFLAAFIQQIDPPEITRMKDDLIALEEVPAQRITKPLLLCVKKRAEHHHVNKTEVGNQLAAVRSANEWLADCDIEGTRTKLIKAIRTRDPRTALSEAHARADTFLSLQKFVVLMLANKTFRIVVSAPPEAAVTIPSPEENHAQN